MADVDRGRWFGMPEEVLPVDPRADKHPVIIVDFDWLSAIVLIRTTQESWRGFPGVVEHARHTDCLETCELNRDGRVDKTKPRPLAMHHFTDERFSCVEADHDFRAEVAPIRTRKGRSARTRRRSR